jgi:bifunctional non-homologous end joining protein LigD
MIFDLDPAGDDPDAIPLVCDGAASLHGHLEDLGVTAYVKTSGSRGLHIHVPLDRRATFDRARLLARSIADRVVADDPTRYTTASRKAKRGHRLYIDTMRNAYAQHAVAPYSLRALPAAPVAAPLDWDEISDPWFDPRSFNFRKVLERIRDNHDPWADIARRKASVERIQRRLRPTAPTAVTVGSGALVDPSTH